MIILSAAGSFAAGAHYYAIDLPEQKALSSLQPENFGVVEKCNTCKSYCDFVPASEYYKCLQNCELIC
jgi:hypothetical protein